MIESCIIRNEFNRNRFFIFLYQTGLENFRLSRKLPVITSMHLRLYWTPVDINMDKSTLQSKYFHRLKIFKFDNI